MFGQVLDEVAHFAGHRISTLLRLERGAVLQPEEHFPDFVFVRIGNDHDIYIVGVEAKPQVVGEVVVLLALNFEPVDRICFSRQRISAAMIVPDRADTLLAIDNLIGVGVLARLPPVDFGNVVTAEDGIDEKLLLGQRPDGRPLVIWLGVDAFLDAA
jgi:hypothetical protein